MQRDLVRQRLIACIWSLQLDLRHTLSLPATVRKPEVAQLEQAPDSPVSPAAPMPLASEPAEEAATPISSSAPDAETGELADKEAGTVEEEAALAESSSGARRAFAGPSCKPVGSALTLGGRCTQQPQ